MFVSRRKDSEDRHQLAGRAYAANSCTKHPSAECRPGRRWDAVRIIKGGRDGIQPLGIALASFALDKWIKLPISPDDLYWARMTNKNGHLFYTTWRPLSSFSPRHSHLTRVTDVLLLKIKDSHVIDIENNDMEDIELFARQPV